jgi:hypothetical protein
VLDEVVAKLRETLEAVSEHMGIATATEVT